MGNYDGRPISDELASEVAIYAALSSNAYHNSDRERFRVEQLGWNLTSQKHHLCGLAYDIYRHSSSGKIVWAFRGTDSMLDYLTANLAYLPFSPFNQYRKANKIFKKFIRSFDPRHVTVCGHSLGGGLALSMSVRHGVPAFTFDSSPRIFDGLGDKHREARRIVVYEDGEILQKIRERYPKFREVVQEESIFKCSYDFSGSQHRGDKLAKGLLQQGSKANPELGALIDGH